MSIKSDYISREAAEKAFQERLNASNHGQMSEAYFSACIDILQDIPAADVIPGEDIETDVTEALDVLNDVSNQMDRSAYYALWDAIETIGENSSKGADHE